MSERDVENVRLSAAEREAVCRSSANHAKTIAAVERIVAERIARQAEEDLAMHHAYRPEAVAEVAVHMGSGPAKRTTCGAGMDGDCYTDGCPQNRDGEPMKSGRFCPLPPTGQIALREQDETRFPPEPPRPEVCPWCSSPALPVVGPTGTVCTNQWHDEAFTRVEASRLSSATPDAERPTEGEVG